jgi:hypothetical protein
MVIYSLLPSLI